MKIIKILLTSIILAMGLRFTSLGLESMRQILLTEDLCNLVSLPLETGLLRETYEGLESALRARGEAKTCVGVTDNGRSFSPDCFQEKLSYRTVMCKAVGNKGVRASISFVNPGIFEWPLLVWWLGVAGFVFAALGLSRLLAGYLVLVFAKEIGSLLGDPATPEKDSALQSVARFFMHKLGISKRLSLEALKFRERLKIFEVQVEAEASARAQSEQEAKSSKQYIEKVREIRHDIRSPLSALQAVHEKIQADESLTKKVLATAIRRIQILADELSEVDRKREPQKLVIAEVAAEETVLLLKNKYQSLKSATLSISYSSEALSPIMVGTKEFQSALENLLENALEAIAFGGEVKLSVKQSAGQCQIAVEDNGCGISKENRNLLFTRGGSFGKLNGLGLGLFHTKENVESWGGTIECLPLEVGTKFCISIPVMQAGVVFAGLPSDPRLQVIDDDSQVAKSLTMAGFEVLESAETFAEGAKLFEKNLKIGSIFVDNRLDNKFLGTDLIAQQSRRHQIYLCTNDFDDLDVINKVRALGVKIIPKPLCFIAQHGSTRGLA